MPFSVSRNQNARGTEGLSIGRVADAMLRKYCNGDPIPAGFARKHFDNAARALNREKLMPIAAQLACALGPLKTEVDAICLREGANGRVGIVVVEFKTSRQTLAQHTASYDKPCLRKPYMDVAGLPNSEQSAHRLQADFGLKALRHTYPHLQRYYMESIVLYATQTGAKIYPVAPFPKTTFDVIGAQPHSVVDPGKNEFPLLPSAPAGGTMIRSVLKRAGHTRIASGGNASCTSLDKDQRECVVGISPGWHRLTQVRRRGLIGGVGGRGPHPLGGGPAQALGSAEALDARLGALGLPAAGEGTVGRGDAPRPAPVGRPRTAGELAVVLAKTAVEVVGDPHVGLGPGLAPEHVNGPVHGRRLGTDPVDARQRAGMHPYRIAGQLSYR